MHTFPHQVIDGFAGPGGWSVACKRLGLSEMGIETDKAAHMTRRANGFQTIRASVADLGPEHFPRAVGKIDSPPCQTFSMAGKGAGRGALDVVLAGVKTLAARQPLSHAPDTDPRTWLVLEPLRWHLAALDLGRPFRWIALEQVPTVLPVWEAFADVLRSEGYSVAVGNLHAEQYGVPQTRKRAILMASLDRPMALPAPTHSRYHVRSPQRLDPGVLPWVSMAEALGWEGFALEAHQGAGMMARGGRDTYPSRPDHAPAFTVTGANVDASGKHGGGNLYMARNSGPAAARDPRTLDEPAYTIRANGSGSHPSGTEWVHERPSTTIVGSFKPEIVAAPGYRVSTADGSRQNAPGSVRVTVEEAAALQSFPPEFVWEGSKTKRYQQVGNAIPPLLAEAVLCGVLGRPLGGLDYYRDPIFLDPKLRALGDTQI